MAKKRRLKSNRKEEAESDVAGGEDPDGGTPPEADDDGEGRVDEGADEALSSESEDEVPPPDGASPDPTSPAPALRYSMTSDGRYHNKQRLLLLSSRGITARYRHLLEDLRTLVPHSKKESKLDVGKNNSDGGIGAAVNEIAEVRGCHTVLFLECRKRGQDGYLWIGRTCHANSSFDGGRGGGNDVGDVPPGGGGGGRARLMIAGGPSVKFHVTNIHTMDELKMTGNCMKGSRPVLSFDRSFEEVDHLRLLKHLFVDVFGTPRGHPKSKPFVDRVMGFYYADGKIWVRNYQILEEEASTAKEAHSQKKITGHAHSTSLVEIGPRFILNPIRIFRGSFGGQTLWVNEDFVNPNVARGEEKREKGEKYVRRKGAQRKRKSKEESVVVPEDPLADVFR